MAGNNVTLVEEPQGFFFELVQEAFRKRQLKAQPETELYLVNLLQHFISTENLYIQDEQGHLKEEPLVLMMKQAMEEERAHTQSLLYRYVGDVSLYVGGFFQESLNRKLVDVDYYIDVGGSAYRQVAVRAEDRSRGLYEELAEKFAHFIEVLADISDKTTPKSERNLLRLYETWLRTGSERAANALREAGIQPVAIQEKSGRGSKDEQ